jgi:hypothetical protein
MRTLRSSVGVLLWTQAVHLTIIAVLVGLVLAARPAAASIVRVAPGAPATEPQAIPSTAPAPALVAISGTVVARGDGLLAVRERGGERAVAFMINGGALLTREGDPVTLDALHRGDDVRMVVDGRTGQVLRLQAEPGSTGVAGTPAAIAALALVAAAVLLVRRQTRSWPAVGGVDGSRARLAMLRRQLAFPRQAVVRGRSGPQRCGA